MTETEQTTKLSKHLSAAVNAIQKEIDKKEKQSQKLKEKILYAEHEASVLRDEIIGLEEQIAKLKGNG